MIPIFDSKVIGEPNPSKGDAMILDHKAIYIWLDKLRDYNYTTYTIYLPLFHQTFCIDTTISTKMDALIH